MPNRYTRTPCIWRDCTAPCPRNSGVRPKCGVASPAGLGQVRGNSCVRLTLGTQMAGTDGEESLGPVKNRTVVARLVISDCTTRLFVPAGRLLCRINACLISLFPIRAVKVFHVLTRCFVKLPTPFRGLCVWCDRLSHVLIGIIHDWYELQFRSCAL